MRTDSKMLQLLCCVVLGASAVSAADYGPHYQEPYYSSTPYPMDYNNGSYPHEKVGPNTNLFFSFEQIRKDQPSQIDTREENIHQYRYRPKSTTTPAPTRAFNDYATRAPAYKAPAYHEQAYQAPAYQAPSYQSPPAYQAPAYQAPEYQPPVNQAPAQQDLSYQGHGERRSSRPPRPPTTMAPPPPPPMPKWEENPQDFRSRPYSQYNPALRAPTTPAPLNQWSGLSHQGYSQHAQSQPSNQIRVADMPSTTAQPHWTEIQAASESPRYQSHRNPHHHQSSSGRGSQKFNWNEVSIPTEDVYKSAMTPVPRTREPPSAVPTLTPWSGDNF